MKVLRIIECALSYLFTFFAGVYGLCLADGEADFFMIFGFVSCLVIAIFTSPLWDKLGTLMRK